MIRKTILFLHGVLGVAQDMEPMMNLLSEKGHRTLAFNFAGHGLNAKIPPEFRIDAFARELDEYLKKHNLEDVVVFGHSTGGYVALYHVANFEDSPISQIFTYGTKFNWSEASVLKELPLLDPDNLDHKYPHSAEILKARHGDQWKILCRSTAHMMQNLEKLDGLTKEDVSEIDIPVTFILGDQDRMVTKEETQRMSQWIHHSTMKTLSHSKHELERSNLRELALMIDESLG